VDVSKLCSLVDDQDTDTNLPRYVVVDDLDILLAHDRSLFWHPYWLSWSWDVDSPLKDSARKYKLKKESMMIYLDDKLETADLKKMG
jgi:hypothetical protein